MRSEFYKDDLSEKKLNAHILVVEDNKINQTLISSYLDKFGCSYNIADNGVNAVKLASENSYDLILMDLYMPDIDGIKAIEHIRESGFNDNVAIIVLTARDLPSDKDILSEYGISYYLSKPIILSDLYMAIKSNLLNS